SSDVCSSDLFLPRVRPSFPARPSGGSDLQERLQCGTCLPLLKSRSRDSLRRQHRSSSTCERRTELLLGPHAPALFPACPYPVAWPCSSPGSHRKKRGYCASKGQYSPT